MYIKLTKRISLAQDTYLRSFKTFYILPKSRNSWLQKYTTFLKLDLLLKEPDIGQSFLFKTNPDNHEIQRTVVAYVDDTLSSGKPKSSQTY